jgi:hypothetical protein
VPRVREARFGRNEDIEVKPKGGGQSIRAENWEKQENESM